MSTSSKTKLVALRVPNDLHARLLMDAAAQGLTLTAYILSKLGSDHKQAEAQSLAGLN